jgi:hypothetical protein
VHTLAHGRFKAGRRGAHTFPSFIVSLLFVSVEEELKRLAFILGCPQRTDLGASPLDWQVTPSIKIQVNENGDIQSPVYVHSS